MDTVLTLPTAAGPSPAAAAFRGIPAFGDETEAGLAAARGGEAAGAVDEAAPDDTANLDTANLDAKDGERPNLLDRYLSPVLDYNFAASHLVILFRDPETGKTVDQIPPESALKQYEEANRRRNLDGTAGDRPEDGAADHTANGTDEAALTVSQPVPASSEGRDGASAAAAAAGGPGPGSVGRAGAALNFVV